MLNLEKYYEIYHEEMYKEAMHDWEEKRKKEEEEYTEEANKEYLKVLYGYDKICSIDYDEISPKNHRRADRRRKDEMKARRKERLAQEIYPDGFHAPHGYYRKGKIHCSCPKCRSKTNDSINKSRGPVCGKRSYCRLAITHKRYGRKNYKASDRRKIDSMLNQEYIFFR